MDKIVIIGNGISGVTAARHIRKNSDQPILIISAETEHFFSRTALMYIYMGHMRFKDTKPYEDWFWEKNNIDLLFDFVQNIDVENKMLQMKSGAPVLYDKLILATGSKPNMFGWPGQELNGVQGLYSYQDLEKLEENTKITKEAVVVGGGLIGVELAEMLISRGINVTFLVREAQFWGNVLPEQEANLISDHLREHHVDLRLNEELDEIIDDGNGQVKQVKTKSGEYIDCQIVGLTVGVSPNIDFIRDSGVEVDRGVLVNEYLETNVQDIYAVGDCVQFKQAPAGRKAIEQVWYTGRIMGETVAQTILGKRTAYHPGPWFNSAKFFDIEYQTYGWVRPQFAANESDFFWKHPNGKMCIHVVWDNSTDEFIGINTFGIRLRHELFDQWLKNKASIQLVMSELKTANFDPEFYHHYEEDIVAKFNAHTGMSVAIKPKKWWQKLMTN
ncbi:MAG: FAD-dependent oxidoreductase [Crocinitomicaceae bacterium]|nr:FAD-dependent oxidoreductase [Crocinitomicaceae bacterium]